MSRLFNGSTQYLSRAGAVVSGEPFTMAAWFYSTSATVNQTIIAVGNNGASGFYGLRALGAVAGDPLRAHVQSDAGSNGSADSTVGYSINTWQHAAGVFTSGSDRTAYLNGGNSGNNTTGVVSPTPDFTSIGALRRSSVSEFFVGRIGHVAVWSAALTAGEVAALADRVSPLRVRPQNLVAYWPILGVADPENSIVGSSALTLTLTAAPTADEPPPLGPLLTSRIWVPVSAVSGTTISVTPAAVSFAGQDIEVGETINVAPAALSVNGVQASVTSGGTTIDVTPAALSINGVQASVTSAVPVTIDVTPASVVYTGVAASVSAGSGPRGRARGRARHYGSLEPPQDRPEVSFTPPQPLPAAERFIPMSELIRELTSVVALGAPDSGKASRAARNARALVAILKKL